MKVAELYMELPSRRLIAYALGGVTAPDFVKDEVRQVLHRGVGAMQRLCQFSPWVAGAQPTMADIYVHHVNTIVTTFGATQLEWDILAEIPGMKEWSAMMSESTTAQSVEADRAANMPDFVAHIKARLETAKG
jgi:glutathione S-transferase